MQPPAVESLLCPRKRPGCSTVDKDCFHSGDVQPNVLSCQMLLSLLNAIPVLTSLQQFPLFTSRILPLAPPVHNFTSAAHFQW